MNSGPLGSWTRRSTALLTTCFLLSILSDRAHAEVHTKVLKSDQWSLITFPVHSHTQSFAEILGDDLPVQDYQRSWTLFRFAPDLGSYYSPLLDQAPGAGTGYWVIQSTGSDVEIDVDDENGYVDATASEYCNPSATCFTLDPVSMRGQRYWSMLGLSGLDDYPLSSLKVVSGSDEEAPCAEGCSMDEAFAADVSWNNVYRYDGDAGRYDLVTPGDTLGRWDGFWFLDLPDGAFTRVLVPAEPSPASVAPDFPVSLHTNPMDPELASGTGSNGSLHRFLGSRDESGNPSRVSGIVSSLPTGGVVHTKLDDRGRLSELNTGDVAILVDWIDDDTLSMVGIRNDGTPGQSLEPVIVDVPELSGPDAAAAAAGGILSSTASAQRNVDPIRLGSASVAVVNECDQPLSGASVSVDISNLAGGKGIYSDLPAEEKENEDGVYTATFPVVGADADELSEMCGAVDTAVTTGCTVIQSSAPNMLTACLALGAAAPECGAAVVTAYNACTVLAPPLQGGINAPGTLGLTICPLLDVVDKTVLAQNLVDKFANVDVGVTARVSVKGATNGRTPRYTIDPESNSPIPYKADVSCIPSAIRVRHGFEDVRFVQDGIGVAFPPPAGFEAEILDYPNSSYSLIEPAMNPLVTGAGDWLGGPLMLDTGLFWSARFLGARLNWTIKDGLCTVRRDSADNGIGQSFWLTSTIEESSFIYAPNPRVTDTPGPLLSDGWPPDCQEGGRTANYVASTWVYYERDILGR